MVMMMMMIDLKINGDDNKFQFNFNAIAFMHLSVWLFSPKKFQLKSDLVRDGVDKIFNFNGL